MGVGEAKRSRSRGPVALLVTLVVLLGLTEAGLARRADLGDHVWRFEAIDPNHVDDGHPHFVCSVCGRPGASSFTAKRRSLPICSAS